jgi:acyl carrier protein
VTGVIWVVNREECAMPTMTTRQVFISHDTEDASFAHRLACDLQGAGVQVWIAPDSIRPGESWVDAIERGLDHSSDMIIVLTPAAIDSQWVKKETEIGIMRERRGQMRVIPLAVERCNVPLLLSSYQMVSFGKDYDVGLRQLLGMLGLRRAPSQPPDLRPSPALSTRSTAISAAIQTRFVEILSEQTSTDLGSIRLASRLVEDLGMDDLDLIELTIALEDEWNLAVPDECVAQGSSSYLRTVSDWVTYLTHRLGP